MKLNYSIEHIPMINLFFGKFEHKEFKGMIIEEQIEENVVKELLISLQVKIKFDNKNLKDRNANLIEFINPEKS